MLSAIVLNILLGLVWVCIGIIVSKIALSGRSIIAFYAAGSWISAGLMWLVYVRWPVVLGGVVHEPWRLVRAMVLTGAVNATGQILIAISMRRGHKGLTWAIVQSAMVISFTMGWAIWDDQISLIGWGWLAGLMVGIMLLASGGKQQDKGAAFDWTWLTMAVTALFVVGLAQILFGIPSRWEGFEDNARLRSSISLTSGALVHTVAAFALKRRLVKDDWPLVGWWSGAAVAAYILTFLCLDRMAVFGLVGVVFPIGIGICVFGFSLYSKIRLKEAFTPITLVGLMFNIIGVVLLAVSRR